LFEDDGGSLLLTGVIPVSGTAVEPRYRGGVEVAQIRSPAVMVGLLGPLQVLDDEGVDVTPRARKQRAVLAFLALKVNSVVRVSVLIDALWGDSPVLRAEKVIQGYISDLRTVVGRETIQTEPDGYRLSVPPDAVDVTRFENLLRSSAQALDAKDARTALEWFNQASALWRGEPLPDLADQISGETEANHLRELHEAGLERSFEARLALGEDDSLIADLETAVASEPYRERRWEQLMIALYRAGRQAEAIRAYQRLRTTLDEGLGIEPREQTRSLEMAILNHDPSLDLIPADPRASEPARVRLPTGNVTFLFTDVEDSTRLVRGLGAAYPEMLQEHRQILRSSVASHDGIEVDTEGNGSFIVFADAGQGLAACLDAQKALKVHGWPAGSEMRVRMGLHTGIARLVDGGYSAISVREAARICDAAHGGQVLLSADTASIVRRFLPEGSSLADRGSFMLNGFDEPERIFQLVHPEVESSFPPLRASPAHSHNLPDTRTAFVGRESDLKAIDDLLSANRVVTIVGPGGVGKSRLAVELAARLAARFEWGSRLCDLSPIDDASLVPSAISAAFGIRDEPGRDPLGAVAQAILDHESLLLVDSCEHLNEAAGTAIDRLLSAVPGLRVLAASRQPTGIEGEMVLRIHPLDTPADEAEFGAIESSEAVLLFESRARLADAGFSLSEDNAVAVADICRRLEGLPLAIELAAAQVSTMALSTIAARLTAGLTVEKSGLHPAVDRHRTLEATVDWSYQLLDDCGQRLLRILSVFANGFTVDAATAVSDGDDPIAVLTTLVDKSLVVWDPDAARYRLLETIRAFARARLEESGELDLAGSRHLAWCAAFADSLKLGRNPHESYELFERELDNFRVALRWAASHSAAALPSTGEPPSRVPDETASDAARLADAIQQPIPATAEETSADATPADAAASWEIVVAPDRRYYDRMESEGAAFPESVVERRFALSEDLLTIGRRAHGVVPEIDLSPPPTDTGISRQHAMLLKQPNGGWSIVDPGSTNGIYLNDADQTLPFSRITGLEDGDQVHIGAWTTITLRRVSASATEPGDGDASY
jgi:predicted ATPase/DNA-binding SARP family transcriptional activator